MSCLVWLDAPFHEESEYVLGFYFWPCFDVKIWRKLFMSNFWKNRFHKKRFFTIFSILGLSRSKQKLLKKIFLSLFLEFLALQTLKVSSKSVTTSVSVVEFMWNYPIIIYSFVRSHQELWAAVLSVWFWPSKASEHGSLLVQYYRLFDVRKVEYEYFYEISWDGCENLTIGLVFDALSICNLWKWKSYDKV